uniref:Fibropellin-1 n=1 Tax=Magallana gigas TaxID=29159 RepID=K1QY86_MAGGI
MSVVKDDNTKLAEFYGSPKEDQFQGHMVRVPSDLQSPQAAVAEFRAFKTHMFVESQHMRRLGTINTASLYAMCKRDGLDQLYPNIDECAVLPCQNNGTCRDLINDYQCFCIDGFNGEKCTNNIDDCLPDPCENNGTCTDLVNDYQWNCMLGFNGTNCENNIDDCLPNPCKNNGTCTDLVNDYQCDCVSGYNGTNCEHNIDECEVQPCQNNGTCIDLINNYQCYCTDGYNGTNCTTGKFKNITFSWW